MDPAAQVGIAFIFCASVVLIVMLIADGFARARRRHASLASGLAPHRAHDGTQVHRSRTIGLFVLMALAACGGSRTSVPIAIRDVTLVDVALGELRPHTTVIVVGNRITAVGPAAATAIPRRARVIEGTGRFLIPGLWDMHSHSLWSPEAMRTFLPLYVAQGVTGIRDMGGTLAILGAFRDSVRLGDPTWPRVVASGAILDGPEPVQADVSIGVADSASATAAVDSLVRGGAAFIKVYTLLPKEAYLAAVAAARRAGVHVAGHVPAAVTPEEAARAGQRSIEHLRDELDPFCSPRDVDACKRLAALFKSERTWQVPTLGVLRFKAYFGDTLLISDPRLPYVSAGISASWLDEREGKLRRGTDYAASKRARYADELWLTGFLARAGVPILAGTDAGTSFMYPGFSLHDELALLVEAGLSPLGALRAATLAPAEYLAARDSMGTVAVGQVADLVLLRADPLADIRATREIETVVLRGKVLDQRALRALLDALAAPVRE